MRCVATEGTASCECPLGQHREGAGCAPDETCTDSVCMGHGMCTVEGGRARCACDPEYDGERCEACASGYHDDGAGGCTDDACLPSPCTVPNRTVCVDGVCGCDPGYHDDGVGGCTTDPCLPHPCGAQACRDAGGVAECFTPVCDDGNPCTTDTPTASGCVYAMRADGSDCSTTACVSGQTCTAGACGGGTPVVCADANPCTVDTCDPVTGCANTVSTAIVPDDGVACTIDSCATGAPVHTPSDAACDDALYCNGVERCLPTDPARDGRGCVVTDVPAPSGPRPRARATARATRRPTRSRSSSSRPARAATTGSRARAATCASPPAARARARSAGAARPRARAGARCRGRR
ncbi:MAG: hypothetical protein M5U28_06415 [Sandaracinaceae bacterium]|nr:hypothetical protein [Sandaracinaceae bacterium]